jgi:hypothetical protein
MASTSGTNADKNGPGAISDALAAFAAQVAKLPNCTSEDVGLLVSAGKLRPLGRPNPKAVKFFRAVELIALVADREWLDEATKTIGQFWKRKNARRSGFVL